MELRDETWKLCEKLVDQKGNPWFHISQTLESSKMAKLTLLSLVLQYWGAMNQAPGGNVSLTESQ